MNKIIFDKSARNFILEAFDKTVDSDGYVVEKSILSQRVLTKDAQEIRFDEFAGIRKGSEIFLKSDLPSIIELSDDLSPERN